MNPWTEILIVAFLLAIAGWLIARVARTVPALNYPYSAAQGNSAMKAVLPPMLVVTAYLVIRQVILLYHVLREPANGSPQEHSLLVLNIVATFLTILLLPFPFMVPTLAHKPRWIRWTAGMFWVLLCAVPLLLQFFGRRMIMAH